MLISGSGLMKFVKAKIFPDQSQVLPYNWEKIYSDLQLIAFTSKPETFHYSAACRWQCHRDCQTPGQLICRLLRIKEISTLRSAQSASRWQYRPIIALCYLVTAWHYNTVTSEWHVSVSFEKFLAAVCWVNGLYKMRQTLVYKGCQRTVGWNAVPPYRLPFID
jgi:hypothetical protein